MDFNQGDRNDQCLSTCTRTGTGAKQFLKFCGDISRAQRVLRDSGSVAISRQELSQEQKKQKDRPPIHYAATERAQSNNSSFDVDAGRGRRARPATAVATALPRWGAPSGGGPAFLPQNVHNCFVSFPVSVAYWKALAALLSVSVSL